MGKKMSGYFKQKLNEALQALVADREINMRLTYSAQPLVILQAEHVPHQYLERLNIIRSKLTETPLSSDQGYVPRQLPLDQAVALAGDILGLFTDVMGGL
jgi:hypothetical protein